MVEIAPSDADGLLRLSLHLAARQWPSVIDDSIQLGFLPSTITPSQRASAQGIARRLVGPYLNVGGGAAAASAYSASTLLRDISAASTDLPTSLPPSMVLLGRAVIQLEGLALRADPEYSLVDDILPVAARIALSEGDTNDGAGSLLVELLYDAAEGGARFSPERLQRLLTTASSASAATADESTPTSLLDVLLSAEGARDIVAREAAGALDALARDALWKAAARLSEPLRLPLPRLPLPRLPLPRLPLPPLPLPPPAAAAALVERLAPRLSPEEELLLVRLPTALAGVIAPTDGDGGETDAKNVGAVPAALSDFAAARVASEPEVRSALAEVARRAVVAADPSARATVDSVAGVLRERLRGSLKAVELPETLADAMVRTPFGESE